MWLEIKSVASTKPTFGSPMLYDLYAITIYLLNNFLRCRRRCLLLQSIQTTQRKLEDFMPSFKSYLSHKTGKLLNSTHVQLQHIHPLDFCAGFNNSSGAITIGATISIYLSALLNVALMLRVHTLLFFFVSFCTFKCCTLFWYRSQRYK